VGACAAAAFLTATAHIPRIRARDFSICPIVGAASTPGDATDGAADGDAVHLDALARPDCGPQRCGDSRAGDGNHHDKFGGFTGEQIINRQHNGGPVFRRFSGPTGTECDQP
jgi:hypothetical protein